MQWSTKEQTLAWMAQLERRVSSGMVAVCADDRVVVVKAHYKRYWSFPGGVIDKGETPLEAAIREVEEEIGVALHADSLAFQLVVDRVSDIAQTYQFVYQAQVRSDVFDTIRIDDHEIEDVAVVTRQQILDGDRYYSQSVRHWAAGRTGYMEQQFGTGAQCEI
jgi:8-oxo-dGTP pyrophosphatase MutT (NUDIX family)